MRKVAKLLTDYVIKKSMVDEADREVYEYGFVITLEVGLFLVASLFIALKLDMVLEGIFFFVIFSPLRSYAGGLHLEKFWICFVLSCLTYITTLLVVKNLCLHEFVSLIVLFALEVFVYVLYPVENRNREINEEENKCFKIKLMKYLCLDFFIGIDADKSSRTKIAYAYDLQTFFEYMKSANPSLKKYDIRDYPISLLDQISPSDIEEYLFYLKYYEKDGVVHTNDERGIKRKLASLRTFYNFYFRKEFIDTNPASKVTLPKIHEKNIIRLDTDEVAQLLDEVESGDSLSKNQQRFHEKTKVRDLALMTLLLGTGIRVSECVGLDMDDVDFKNNGIKVHRKGGADVIVYFGDEVRDALLSYWEERSIITPAEGHANALFLSLQRKRISVRSVENLVKKYSRLVTTVKNITPHKLRSTYGTTLYQETGDIYLVADVLGHKDVNTTRKHYAAQEDSRRRAAARVVHLRED